MNWSLRNTEPSVGSVIRHRVIWLILPTWPEVRFLNCSHGAEEFRQIYSSSRPGQLGRYSGEDLIRLNSSEFKKLASEQGFLYSSIENAVFVETKGWSREPWVAGPVWNHMEKEKKNS